MNSYLTATCQICKKGKKIPMTMEQVIRLNKGLSESKHIQDILPELEPRWREMFISGICPDCWETNIAAME